jgi:hypothetical protein
VSVRLDCPLCGATLADGAEPVPGCCPRCGACFTGGADTPQAAVEALLAAAGAPEVPAGGLTRRLFELDPDGDLGGSIAITSDRREGFYRWWVFWRAADGELGTLLRRVLASG